MDVDVAICGFRSGAKAVEVLARPPKILGLHKPIVGNFVESGIPSQCQLMFVNLSRLFAHKRTDQRRRHRQTLPGSESLLKLRAFLDLLSTYSSPQSSVV